MTKDDCQKKTRTRVDNLKPGDLISFPWGPNAFEYRLVLGVTGAGEHAGFTMTLYRKIMFLTTPDVDWLPYNRVRTEMWRVDDTFTVVST